MKILVTGGTGFIGKRLVNAIDNERNEIRIVSRKKDKNNPKVIQCDLASNNLPSEYLRDVSAIFHLAAYTHDLSNPIKQKNKYEAINIKATENLVKEAVLKKVKIFIFVSSVKAGEANISLSNAKDFEHQEPQGIYGKTKREAERRIINLAKGTETKIHIIRPPLVYGPGVKGNIRLMFNGIKQGWFPPLPDAKNRRSMIHVDDLVMVMLLVMKKNNPENLIYIPTDGQYYSSSDIYETLSISCGKNPKKIRIPLCFFKAFSIINSNFKYKISKIFNNEFYHPRNIEELDFKPKYTLSDINETIY